VTDVRTYAPTPRAAAKPATSASAGPRPDVRAGCPEQTSAARWPLLLLALPAVVAIWSGWVGLGGMAGFGPVTLLPGISRFRVNTAVTLPVGMEVYAAYALRAWLTPGAADRARTFARRSSLAALALGAAGQVAYHLMTAAHWVDAPWPVTIAVSCVPVAVLGMGASLAHLLGEPVPVPLASAGRPEPVPVEPAVEPAPQAELEPEPERVEPEPAAEPARLALVEPAEPAGGTSGTADSTEPRRYRCDCGCGREVPKATRSRHRAKAAAAGVS
jgi:hypothetical protein